MSNEWDFEDENRETANSEELQQERVESEKDVPYEAEQNTEERKETVQHHTVQNENVQNETEQNETVQQETAQSNNGTYHWVNPEYQKRQQGTADAAQNTYDNGNYRENINSAAQSQNPAGGYGQPDQMQNNAYQNQAGQNNAAQTNGYQGGGYHSNWQNQSTNEQGPQTGQRRYGSYQLNQEPFVKEPKRPKVKKPKKPMGTGKKFLVAAGMAVVFGVIAGSVMFGVNSLGNYLTGQNKASQTYVQVPTTETPEPKKNNTVGNISGEFSVAEVASNCMPSVVSITNASVQTVNDFFGGMHQRPIESTGSGIIVGQNDTELLIATNNHVVEGAETITVAFSDDAVCEALTKGTDPDNDLAVIAVKLADMTPETLGAIKIVKIGDSDSLQIGEQVVAIGNALGYGQSVTSGWISAVDRELMDENGKTTGHLIQTDAAINPGNSGGALLNMRGELIGINSAKAAATEVEGMGYAIPIATAQPILDELMNRQTRHKTDKDKAGYVGVTCLNVEQSAVQMYGIPQGAFVDSVEEGGPAEAAGIQKGDVIVKFDGLTVYGGTDLVGKLEYYEAGETVEVVISRAENGEYKEQTVTVTLGKRSEMKQSVPQR